MRIIGIIPARYGSSRFPGKPLALIHGVPMILRVVAQAEKCKGLASVVVATDDQRIFDVVRDAGKNVVMTSPDHPSGTDRCLEAFLSLNDGVEAVLNIQGDEPYVRPEQLDQLCDWISKPHVSIATLAVPISEEKTFLDPNKVKVVMNNQGKALYFSRSPIPFERNSSTPNKTLGLKHLGLYAYKSLILKEIALLRPSSLELKESLEQLRWLESGYEVYVGVTQWETPAVDTPEDLNRLLEQDPPF